MNSADVMTTIDSEGLSSFCITMLDDADGLTKLFDEITNKVNELNEYLSSDILEQINNEYDEIKKNYGIIHNNIITYSEDFIAVKNIIEDGMKEITIKFEIEQEEFLKKSREVN